MTIDAGILDEVTQQFLTGFQRDGNLVCHAAQNLFYFLVTIQLAFMAIQMTIAGESLDRFLEKLVLFVLSIGFYYTLIQSGGYWIPLLLNGFIEVGEQAGVTSLDPSSLLSQGMSISGAILKGFFNWGLLGHPFVSIVGAIVCIAIIVIYALMAAELTLALIKSYVLICVGSLFFSFGASDITHDMMKRYVQAVIGLGLKLMMLYLILGVGQTLGSDWATQTAEAARAHELLPMLAIFAAVIVYFLILKNIPPFIANLSGVGGFHNYGEAGVGIAMYTALTASRLITKMGNLLGKSAQMTTQLMKAGVHSVHAYQASKDSISGFHRPLGTVAKTLGKSAVNSLKEVALKKNQKLSFGQKFNQHLVNQVKNMNKKTT